MPVDPRAVQDICTPVGDNHHMSNRVLFLCTGNYYRSRYAEILFNNHARRHDLPWSADSRALAIELGACNIGPVSQHVLAAIATRGIDCPTAARMPVACALDDLSNANIVVALKELEHRPYLQRKFPGWEERVTYWHVHDIDQATPAQALAEIETLVTGLIERLK